MLGRLIRVAVAAGLTGYILWRSDPRAVAAAAAGVDWRWIGVAVLLVLVDRALMAYRWVALLCTIESERRPPIGAAAARVLRQHVCRDLPAGQHRRRHRPQLRPRAA